MLGAQNQLAGRLAAQHLLDLGHRNIGLIFPATRGNDRSHDRLKGATQALAEADVTVPSDWQWTTPYSVSQAKAVCVDLMAQQNRPSALLCGNDVIAHGCVYAAAQVGVRVPEEMSVMGIGDFKGSKEMEPALSTVRLPARTIGEQAGGLLVRMIAGDETDVVREALPPEIMARASTRAL